MVGIKIVEEVFSGQLAVGVFFRGGGLWEVNYFYYKKGYAGIGTLISIGPAFRSTPRFVRTSLHCGVLATIGRRLLSVYLLAAVDEWQNSLTFAKL